MNNGLRIALAVSLGAALLQAVSAAETTPAPTNAPPKPSPAELKQNMSYAIGMNIGNSMKRGGVELDLDTMIAAIKDVLAGRTLKMTDMQARDAMQAYQMEARNKQQQVQREAAEKNKKEGAAFLAENKTKPGIKTHSVKLEDGTTDEFQYKVITEGTGATPKPTDTVTVNYRGTLINGKEFDNSASRGQPAKFQVTRVIRGWTEALQLMKAGSKWQLFIPSSLAYRDSGSMAIEPGSTLVFDVELVGIDTPQAQPPAQPLTSDIIRVPSADELKKGAKIEVIKAEDLEKYTNSAAKKAEQPAKK
jgi:FKBP-type peptidyl-prolyl cis-trans isomerase FklB